MKRSIVCKWMVLSCVFLSASSAWCADDVMMATTEDLNAFDAQLGSQQPAAVVAKSQGLGQAISEEAKKLKTDSVAQAFGRKIRGQAMGHGVGASDESGAAAAASFGAGGNATVGKGEPGQGRQNAKNPKK